jgi:hypothetical protein
MPGAKRPGHGGLTKPDNAPPSGAFLLFMAVFQSGVRARYALQSAHDATAAAQTYPRFARRAKPSASRVNHEKAALRIIGSIKQSLLSSH